MSENRMPAASPWWAPQTYADRRPFLVARRRITTALRAYFDRHDFTEVETAILQVSPGNEAHISAFATDLEFPGGGSRRLYLHSSPEFACKKLLAAGEQRIFTFARVFRNRERGPLHHPEFTMLEWYRAEEPYEALMADCAALLRVAAEAAGARQFTWRGGSSDVFAEPERLSLVEAFERYAGIDLIAALGAGAAGFARMAAATGVRTADDDSWSDIFSRILSEKIEPRLGFGRPTLLDRYPAQEAALARLCADDSRFAERFELYVCGVELANGFGELTDAAEQRRRFEAEMAERQQIYGDSYPIDADFLAALAEMPDASGIALGLDRLVMLASGAPHIESVLWTPVAGV